MDLFRLPSIIARWRWLIIAVVALTGLALGIRLATTPPVYEARVRLQVTVPQIEDAPLLEVGNRSSSFLRDDLTLVRNNFAVIAASGTVYSRTLQQLGLQSAGSEPSPERLYTVEVRPLRDSDFVDLVVTVPTAGLGQRLANIHATHAIQYYGEMRAMPATATKTSLEKRLASHRGTVTLAASSTGGQPGQLAAPDAKEVEEQQARETYQLLLRKHAAAVLAEESALRASHIQVIEPASPAMPLTSLRNLMTLAGLTLIGGLGLALLLALVAETLVPPRGGRTPAVNPPAPDQPAEAPAASVLPAAVETEPASVASRSSEVASLLEQLKQVSRQVQAACQLVQGSAMIGPRLDASVPEPRSATTENGAGTKPSNQAMSS